MAAAAARARAAIDREVLWAGQASKRTTGGRSAIGTVIRSSRNGLVSTRGSTATLRPRAIRFTEARHRPGIGGFPVQVFARQVGHLQARPLRERVGRRQHGDRRFGQQCLGVQPVQLVGRRVQQRGICLSFAQHARRAGPEGHLDRQYLWLAFVSGEDGREQARVAAGLHGQDQARVAGAGPLRSQRRGGHRLQCDARLGLSLGKIFGGHGFDVALIARSKERLGELTGRLAAEGVTAAGFPADVTDRSALAAALDSAAGQFGRIDVLHYASPGAGTTETLRRTGALDVTVDNLGPQIECICYGAITATRAVLPTMLAAG